MMKWLALAFALFAPTQAGLRFGCSTLTVQRLDPVVEPGNAPSAHLHHIVGGNAFSANMSGDIGEQGTCTTCTFSEDFSNYWTAVLFYKHPTNGSYKRVPVYPNAQLSGNNINGGITIYYTQVDFNTNGKNKITSFKPGFRMTVGSPATNTLPGAKSHPGLRYTCLKDILTRGAETPDFPAKACAAGIMAIHHFPACWDGKNLDSPDHQSHMFDTTKGGFQPATACPASHPVRMPQVAYETMWNTTQFNSMPWPKDGSQPFVWSFDDTKGYGTHGDYLFGWKGDSLQKAMDSTCMFQGCENGKPLKSQNDAAMNKCSIKTTVNDQLDGWLTALPGRAA